MKKHILLFLLFTGFLQAQTYPVNPTKFGKISLNTNVEDNTAGKISVQSSTNEINWLLPENIPINQPPHPINYTATTPTLGAHLIGIDTRLGTIVQTTAGTTARVFFTGETSVVNSVTYYNSSLTGKGSVASVNQTVVNPDNTRTYFGQDVISVAQVATTISAAGTYAGQLTVRVSDDSAQEKFGFEVYKTNSLGVPIASGITGSPVGSLGVTVVAILDSGVIDLVQNATTNVSVSGVLASPLTLNTGERIRYHAFAEKVGTTGASFTYTLYYGSDNNSYYDVPVTPTTDTVINKSLVSGTTSSDALNTLNADKLGGSGTVNTLPVFTASKTLGNSNVAQSGYSVGIGGVLNNEGIGDPANVFNVTNDTGGAGAGVPRFLIQGTSYANDTGLANVTIRKARGTAAIPLAVQNNDFLTFIGFKGYATNKFASASGAIEAIATENFTNTANGTMLNFEVTANGVFDNRTIAHQILNNGNSIFGNVNYALGARISTITDSKLVIRDDALTTGQLNIVGLTNENKRLRLGYHTTSNYGFVQSLTAGTSFDPLSLNPLGGNVGIGVTNPFYKIHSNSMASDNYMQFTNNFTGSLTNDGLLFGVNVGSGTVQLLNQENTPFDIFTNSVFRARFNADGGLSIGTNVSLGNGTINATGNITSSTHTLTATPTTSAGTYDILTRNTSTGVVEKVLSSTIATTSNAILTTTNQTKEGILTIQNPADSDDKVILDPTSASGEKLTIRNNQGTTAYKITDTGAGQGSYQAGTTSAYIYGRQAGPLQLGASIAFIVPNATDPTHAVNLGQLNGAMIKPIRTITATTTALISDYTILCDATSGAITLNLPIAASNTGLILCVKKINNTANNITIDPSGAELIDLGATLSVSTYLQSVMFQSNGTGWYKIN